VPVLSGNDWSPCSGIALIREIESNFEKMFVNLGLPPEKVDSFKFNDNPMAP